MPRAKKDRSANALRPRPKDLFKQVPVTLPEILRWVNFHAPHLAHSKWRVENYARGYNVPEKIRAAKKDGRFWLMP